jgi:subtilase family serine protease
MRRSALAVFATAAATFVGLLVGPVTAAQAAPSPIGVAHRAVHSCAVAPAGHARCGALVVVPASAAASPDKPGKGRPKPPPPPPSAPQDGYFPVDLQAAYNLGGLSGGGRTVAIVDAYDDPTAEADLAVYRSAFGLSACTTANECFTKVNQSGGTRMPKANAGWAQEISLDLDMVSAICPDCHILLVEASSSSFSNLGAAVNYAASVTGVAAISNSYGGSDTSQISAYNHPGIAITASTGDDGYGVESPASFDSVIAVGGTSLAKSSTTRGWSETAWSGAGSGCSSDNDTTVQDTDATHCSGKAVADVSAVANPNTGVAVYDSTSAQGVSGWLVFGGTSVSSPIIASVFALAGNTGGTAYPASYLWSHPTQLNDVISGSNGTCSTTVWCHAGTGWDGPTGLGTPNGIGAF